MAEVPSSALHSRRLRVALLLFTGVLAGPGAALADPPVPAAIAQYTEVIPSATGKNTSGKARPLPKKVDRAITKQGGRDVTALTAIASDTARGAPAAAATRAPRITTTTAAPKKANPSPAPTAHHETTARGTGAPPPPNLSAIAARTHGAATVARDLFGGTPLVLLVLMLGTVALAAVAGARRGGAAG